MGESPDPRLAAILDQLVQSHGWHRATTLTAIRTLWRDIVGEGIDQHTQILTLTSDGVLVVAVPSSVWSQEILYYKPQIVQAFANVLGASWVKDVRTRVRANRNQSAGPVREGVRSPYYRVSPRPPDTDNLHELLARVQEKYETAARVWMDEGFQPCARCHAPTPHGYTLCVTCDLERRKKS